MKAKYPDWVMKYKEKGMYVNKSGDNYRLYKAHCEYRNGKYVRVVDEYMGTITESDGLIPSKGNVLHKVICYDYGLYYFLFLLFDNIYQGQIKLHKRYADTIMFYAIKNIYNISDAKVKYTALVLLYPKANNKHLKTNKITDEIDRVVTMMKTYLSKVNLNDNILSSLSTLTLVSINKRYYLSEYDPSVDTFYKNNNFEVKKHV